jgi:hypothetical protein
LASLFKRKTSREVGTSSTAVNNYIVPIGTTSTIIGLSVSNITGNTIYIDVTHDDGASNTYLIKDAPVPTGGALIVVGGDQKVVLEANDSIRIISDTETSADVVMSILETS